MQTIFFTNDRDRPLTLVVEPWAWAKDLSPGEAMAIDYADLVDREIVVHFQPDGSALLSIPADGIRIRTQEEPFECGESLPPPVISDGANVERLLPKNVEHLFDKKPTKNPPRD